MLLQGYSRTCAGYTCHMKLALFSLIRTPMFLLATAIAALIAIMLASTHIEATKLRSAPAGATCSPALPHASGDFDQSVQSGGLERDYILHVPPSYDGTAPAPLVLNLHGLGSYAEQQAGYSELPAKADDEGFILVTPNGTVTEFFTSRHWNFLTGIPESPDDVAFIDDLLDALEAQLCIDSSRVFSTGISNGAMMSVRLACDLSDRIAAIAPVSGLYYPPWSPDLAIEPGCNPVRPVPVIAFHGTDDPIVPYQGGPLAIVGLEFELSGVEDEVLPAWAEHNGCSSGPSTQQVTEHVAAISFDGCYAGASVQLYRVEGGGHLWPGADDLPGDDLNDEISASDLLWAFFEEHPLTYLTGDAGCNGTLDSVDAALLLQQGAGLVDMLSCPAASDVNGDGTVDSRDVALILQYVAGILSEPPA